MPLDRNNYYRVTLLVPCEEHERDPDDWDYTLLLDAERPVWCEAGVRVTADDVGLREHADAWDASGAPTPPARARRRVAKGGAR